MSNTVVGNVYQSIIEDVISASRVDFEENGVEEGVLADLRQGWQKKLSQYNVAQFPWDPKPDLEQAGNGAAAAPTTTASSMPAATTAAQANAAFAQPIMDTTAATTQAGGLPMPSLPMPSLDAPALKTESGQEHAIKLEPDTQNGGMSSIPTTTHVPPPNFPPMPVGGGNAAMRAVQALQNTYGQRAAASINAIQSGMQQQPGQQPTQQQQQQQRPAGIQQMNAAAAQQYRAQVAAQQAAQLNGTTNGVNRSQMDGAGDEYEGVLVQQRAAGEAPVELGRMEIDGLLHEQILQQAKEMEGGGLMVPLRQATKHKRRAVRSGKGKEIAGSADAVSAYSSSRTYAVENIVQADGPDDDDDDDDNKEGILVDEDAINSDLDDPDEDQEEDDDDDDMMGPIMLCVYDKVQRVKNKWKCTLKDGVLTVNGKEYVFHKATGEYEW